ncbi:nicolin-1 [Oncorhynchus keta]|uniref:nicolin-1 n=1 Tax=Oncorhynchus keta TaxID=8018 RepID=UPI00227A7666|nr:nicolin-1 [Oncorhynchus keta]
MSVNTVPCTVKPTVTLQIGDAETDSSRPGVYVIDVTLPIGQTVNIQEISFKNYYTAYVSVRLLRRDGEGAAKWATCLRNHCLMSSPHTEEGSQDYCSVYRQQMLIEPDNVTSVRLILRQPSSAWLNFSVEDIKIHPCLNEDSEWDIPDWLSDLTQVDQLCDLQGLPDPQTVSCSIQQMWALTEVMQSNQTTASIGRFDVDGCYDINLLSFT